MSFIPARLLFSPLNPLNPSTIAAESDAALLSDLRYCRSTSRFFTLPTANLIIEPRPSRSAKQFFCPVCPKSPLKISSTSIKCPTCAWQSSTTSITTVSQLLERDADPFPWISAEIRRLTRLLAKPIHADDQQDPLPHSTSLHRLRGTRQSLRYIQRQQPEMQLSKQESAALCAQKFAEDQQQKEKRVFSQWMPQMDSPDWNSSGRPKGDLAALLDEHHIDALVDLDQRLCNTTWRKAELAPRRRVPPPKVSIRSPFGGGKTRNATDVAPEIQIWISDGCQKDSSGASVIVQVFNKQKLGELRVSVANANAPDQRGEAVIAQGETTEIMIAPFSFQKEQAADMLHEERMCYNLATIDMKLQYVGRDAAVAVATEEHENSQLRIYARHPRLRERGGRPTTNLLKASDAAAIAQSPPQLHVAGVTAAK